MKSFPWTLCVLGCLVLAACGGSQPVVESNPPPPPPAPIFNPDPQEPSGDLRVTNMVDVPAGVELTLALDAPLSSETSSAGDRFTATVVQPIVVDNLEVIPAGSTVEGTVTDASPARTGASEAKLTMNFATLRLTSGYRTNIVGSFHEVGGASKGHNAAVIGGSAAGGALLGRILGKDTKSAVIGAIIGGSVGTAVVMGREKEQAVLPADTPFALKLEEGIRVPRA